VPGRLAVGATFDFADELDAVPPSTGGETAPETAPKVYAESGFVVTTVKGTGSKELTVPVFELEIEPVEREDTADGDLYFEMPKRVSGIMHVYLRSGRFELCAVAVLAWRRSR